MRPGTRFFIGPLTPAQQRRRERNRQQYRDAADIADTRNIPMSVAFTICRESRGFVRRYIEHLHDCEA